ncbi:MAG: isoprenyl transferase [Bacteroidales bacterium]|jgi:undecaprenyl diphosphate synthase|nr:isoprenyl transferase [Bacteroidales bacterium]
MATKDCVNKEKLPLHVAIIMDGNGRWAQRKGNHRIFGHQNGVVAVRETVEAAAELGIQYLTLYAFSTENWNRPREEIEALMMLLVQTIKNEMTTLNKNNVRLHAIGDMRNLPDDVRIELELAIANTRKNSGLNLILALSYSGRWEILDAMRRIGEDLKNNRLQTQELSCDTFVSYLHTAEFPDPELLIRTSGEYRLSNFLLWQLAYTELYFTDVLWPDFRKENFYDAIVDFQKRERRFGMISAQVKSQSV